MHLTLNLPAIWLVVASFLAGALNAMAGGGSFLSFPALLGVGVPPIQANATNTVALWPGQFTSIAAYWEDLKHNTHLVWPLGTAALLGGCTGGMVLLHTGQATFLHLVPWLLLLASTLFAASGPISRWLNARARGRRASDSQPSLIPIFLGTIFVCFYIGYFGAGAGFLIMSLLALFGIQNINQINALKVVTTTLANGIAVVVFIVQKQILWQHCVLMMLTAAIGGYLGARGARNVDPRLMRAFVIVIGFGMAAYFFWKTA
ncbi:hypothetical protein HNQ77_005139 [Silvibacterium bohemicum]|uniref:Probable membrane transporter protein n=1 Tax=Silvibacterium bohemicum TaxID=1577686 RepID=A0A841KA38_9BACT|nr:sulfite exporter TauE/SafE family protein [Silvibacterium bohemicum]MBB6147154.1 hypothetical protein [Silvibacterium bohemicum]